MAESASKLAVSTACAESASVSPATSVERHAAGACRAATGRITILKTIADVMKAIGGAVANCCHPFCVPSPGLSVEPQIAQVAVTGPGRPRASGLRIALYVSAGGQAGHARRTQTRACCGFRGAIWHGHNIGPFSCRLALFECIVCDYCF